MTSFEADLVGTPLFEVFDTAAFPNADAFTGPSLVLGRFPAGIGAFFGGVTGTFSAVLLAQDVVGLAIRARKDSSAGGRASEERLCLEDCTFTVGGGPREGLLLDFRNDEGFLDKLVLEPAVVLVRLGERDKL